jgi:hypothetical protein
VLAGKMPRAHLLQYSKPTVELAANAGIVIHHTSEGHSYDVDVAWSIVLCKPGEECHAFADPPAAD